MKTVLLSAFLFSAFLVSGKTVEELSAAYQNRIKSSNTKRVESVDKLNAGYLRRLDTIQSEIQKSGKLEEIEQIQKEIQAIQLMTWPLDPLSKKINTPVKKARKIYSKARFEIEKKHAGRVVELTEIMLGLLEREKISATKNGELREAKDARDLSQKLNNSPDFAAARAITKKSNHQSGGPAAFQIRRYGDDLEVLVHYDANGEVSFKSKISNVIETTDAKREKGETVATILGEFLGAPGYEVHSYTVLDHIYNTKRPVEESSVSSFVLKYATRIADQNGLQLTVSAEPSNAYYAIKNMFPPERTPGTYRVTCSYFIPKGNRSLDSFSLYQNFGKKIENHKFNKKGKWTTRVIESQSYSSESILRLYPHFRENKTLTDAAGESLYLGSLKIEHIRFSAFIHSTFDEDGELQESFVNSSEQQLFATNGKLVPQ